MAYGHPKYEVSNFGRVRRCVAASGTRVGKILSGWIGGCDYVYVGLSSGSIVRNKLVSNLVLEAFVGPRPNGQECNHKDGNKTNNCVWNLEWTTYSGNIRHAIDFGLRKTITKSLAWEIKKLLHYGLSSAKIGRRVGVAYQTVINIKHGYAWKRLVRTPV